MSYSDSSSSEHLSPSSSTAVAYRATFVNGESAHPTLQVTIPASFLDAPSVDGGHTCAPFLLVRLPPGIFIDPYTFPTSRAPPSVSRESRSGNDNAASDTSSPAPSFALAQGRDVIKAVDMLNSSASTQRRTTWDFAKVELEKSVGYSISAEERASIAEGKPLRRRRKHSFDAAHDDDLLIGEYNAALISLHRVRLPDTILSASQAGVPLAEAGEASTVEPKAQQIDIDIPLHTRYPIPIGRPSDVSVIEHLSSTGDTLIRPSKGAYTTVLLEFPHAIWTCSGYGLLSDDRAVYERTTSDDLLAPMHTHLALPDHMTSYGSQLYSLVPPFGMSREPFRLQIPTGDAGLAGPTQLATLASLLLATLFIVAHVRSLVRSVQ